MKSLTRYDAARGCFVLAGEKPMKRPSGCTCHPESPFLWRNRTTPSVMYVDKTNRPKGENGLSISQRSTMTVEKQRKKGINPGYIKGVSRNKEAEITRIRDFHVYSKAVVVTKEEDDEQQSA